MVFFDQRVKVALKLMIFVIFFVCSLSRSAAALCTLAHITARASVPEMGGGGWIIFINLFFIRLGLDKVFLKGRP